MIRRGPLAQQLRRRRSPEESRALSRRWWAEAASSLWSPVLVFAAAFAVYLCVVPFAGRLWPYARYALVGVTAVCLGWLALGAALALVPPVSRRRGLRLRAVELLEDLHLAVRRRPGLSPVTLAELVELARRLETAWAEGDEGTLTRELERTARALDEKLPQWRRGDLASFLAGFLKAALVVVVLRVFLLEPFSIPSGSMLPTLQIGDYVLVNKLLFGVQLPFLNKVPFVTLRRPQRGDVVVFNNPLDDSINLVKRVVGVPGDRIEIIDEQIHVNGEPQPRVLLSPSYAVEDRMGGRWFARETSLYRETLGGVEHLALQYPSHPYGHETQGPYEVPEGSVFVMGDNRDGSEDSRAGFGLSPKVEFVPYGFIKGKAVVVFLSVGPDAWLRRQRLFLPIR